MNNMYKFYVHKNLPNDVLITCDKYYVVFYLDSIYTEIILKSDNKSLSGWLAHINSNSNTYPSYIFFTDDLDEFKQYITLTSL